jgi:hypothetical protein
MDVPLMIGVNWCILDFYHGLYCSVFFKDSWSEPYWDSVDVDS